MKKLLFSFVFLLTFSLSNNLQAQDATPNNNIMEDAASMNKVEILTNLKATRQQKKLSKKIKKYVSHRFLRANVRTEALLGKTVKVQINTDKKGLISAISVIEGQGVKMDKRVVELIKAYDAKKPIANANIAKPSVLQVEIPLVAKRYY